MIYQVFGYEKRDMTWRVVPRVGLVMMFFGSSALLFAKSRKANSPLLLRSRNFRGKSVFELRCATCHGLDALGGEHAPDVVRGTEVKTLSDQALLNLIHDGIPQRGMPGFSDMGAEDSRAVVAYLRFLQGPPQGRSRQVCGDLHARRSNPRAGSFLRKGRLLRLSSDSGAGTVHGRRPRRVCTKSCGR